MDVFAHAPTTVGLVGAGSMATTHLAAWRDLGVPISVYAPSGASALVARVGHGRVVPTLEALLRSATVVDVCTPTPSHPALVERATAAGRHVICEKPLARTAAEAARLVGVCRRARVQLHVAHVVRWFAPYAAAHRQIVAGGIGDLTSLELRREVPRPAQGWFADARRSGGVLLDLMVHDLDAARWFAGEVVEVVALEHRSPQASGAGVTTQVELRHTSGALSRVVGTWGPPQTSFATAFRLVGTAGVIKHRSSDAPATEADDPYRHELRDFLAAISDGVAPRVTPADAVAAIVLAEAAARSVALGGPVPVVAAPPV